jgi:hypothetical protein
MNCLGLKVTGLLLALCLLWSCSLLGQADANGERDTDEAFLTGNGGGKGTVSTPAAGQGDDSDEDEDSDDEGEEWEQDEEFPDDSIPETVFLYWDAISESEIVFEFSHPVIVEDLEIIPFMQIGAIEDGESTVRLILDEELETGEWYEAVLTGKDQYENHVDVQVSFRYRPGQIPELLITELRTEYSNPKAEFIELRMLSDGNLEGLKVFIASNTKNPLVYVFGQADVTKGQYVVLHLRTLEESCISEYNGKIDESGGADSSPAAWDFWIDIKTELLRKTDAVYVTDKEGFCLDAVMFAEYSETWKDKVFFTEASAFLFAQGAWKSEAETVSGPQDAVNTNKTTTTTRTICRDETTANSHTASDWYITATSGATPGRPNNPNRYAP